MATLFTPGKGRKRIKNLGWLLKNWQSVAQMRILLNAQTQLCELPEYPEDKYPCLLEVRTWSGQVYSARWASNFLSHILGWLDRPVFRGLTIAILPNPAERYEYTIGGELPEPLKPYW